MKIRTEWGSVVLWTGSAALFFFLGCGEGESNEDSDAESSGSSHTGGGETGGTDTGTGGRGNGSSGGSGNGSQAGAGGGTGGGDCSVFPAQSAWNRDVSNLPVHDHSAEYVASIGEEATMHPDFGTVWDGAPIGIPYVLVGADTPAVDIDYSAYGRESDPGPFPIPLDAPIEGGPDADGDRHVIAVDTDACMLYELYAAHPTEQGWRAASGAAFDLTRIDDHPEGCTSADAAGLPIYPGLVRYDEVVEQGKIEHALRFTVERSQRAYVYPARHYASDDDDPTLPPMGLRFRMKSTFDCSSFSSEAQVVCAALKRYGMILADNGSNWYLSGAPDPRWDDDALGDLKTVPGSAFEVVDTGDPIVTDAPECQVD